MSGAVHDSWAQAGPWSSGCVRCGRAAPLDDTVEGCPTCSAAGVSAPMLPVRPDGMVLDKPATRPPAGAGPMWRWRRHLVPVGEPVSLGEGGTPLARFDDRRPGRLLLKQEGANPTGSFKDRLASAAVSRARHVGAETVVVSSSGNAGVSVAAYAAAAGLQAVLLTVGGSALTARAVATAHAFGATVAITADWSDRWLAARTGAAQLGWFPVSNHRTPPVASHPSGVHAYRTIAYEIAEALDWQVPDWVVVPTSRGDGLWGIWAGFVELVELGWVARLPRMAAVVRFPSLAEAVAGGAEQPQPSPITGPVEAVSIGDPQATAMATLAIRQSRGEVLVADDAAITAAHARLVAQGFGVELSSAAALCGARELRRRGLLEAEATAVLLVTARDAVQPGSSPQTEEVVRLTAPGDLGALRALTRR